MQIPSTNSGGKPNGKSALQHCQASLSGAHTHSVTKNYTVGTEKEDQ